MRLSVKLLGEQQARARLAVVGRKVEPVIRGTLNTTATQARAQVYVRPLLGAFPKRKFLNDRMKIKRANRDRMNARIIPSSSGVAVTQYRSWSFEVINATRARIFVVGPHGKKVAAGFVNPSSPGRMPLATRSERARNITSRTKNPQIKSYRYALELQEAMGPSIAYWFKRLTDSKAIRWTNIFMRQEFERRIRREIAKYS